MIIIDRALKNSGIRAKTAIPESRKPVFLTSLTIKPKVLIDIDDN
jgi:hypothetical protein